MPIFLLSVGEGLGLLTVIAFGFGWKGVIIHSLISFLGLSLMEMVNYLSHYALIRASDGDKRSPIADQHSWESNNKVTNWFIFNAGKHSHHHRVPSEHNYNLRLAGVRSYLPYGLPMMTLIGLVPPIYFSVMDRLINENTLETARARREPVPVRV